MATKVVYRQGDKVRMVTRTYDVAGELVDQQVVITEVYAVSRFGMVIVDDIAFNESDDGRWIGQHTKGKKRNVIVYIEKA